MKKIFLKIGNNEIYYNESDSIQIENTNIPHKNMKFNMEYKNIY